MAQHALAVLDYGQLTPIATHPDGVLFILQAVYRDTVTQAVASVSDIRTVVPADATGQATLIALTTAVITSAPSEFGSIARTAVRLPAFTVGQ